MKKNTNNTTAATTDNTAANAAAAATNRTIESFAFDCLAFEQGANASAAAKAAISERATLLIEANYNDLASFCEVYNNRMTVMTNCGDMGAIGVYVVSAKTGLVTKKLVTTHNAERVSRHFARALQRVSDGKLTFTGATELQVVPVKEKIEKPLVERLIEEIGKNAQFKDISPDTQLEKELLIVINNFAARIAAKEERAAVEAAARLTLRGIEKEIDALKEYEFLSKRLGKDVGDIGKEIAALETKLQEFQKVA